MKLLDWMHNKLRLNSIHEPFKDFTIGNQCVCKEEDRCMSPSFGSFKQNTKETEKYCYNSQFEDQDKTNAESDEVFHGFLTIGTLGSEPIISEPGTPTFPFTNENHVITDSQRSQNEVTEDNLKFINYKLEKFIESEAYKEKIWNDHGMMIIEKKEEEEEEEEEEKRESNVICPLQAYLFGSSVEYLESTKMEAGKKEKTTLQDLFGRSENSSEKQEIIMKTKNANGNHNKSAAMHFMKKMIKKFHTYSKSSSTGKESADHSFSTKKKLHKVLRMFHRKVHPENTRDPKEFMKSQENGYNNNGDQMYPDEVKTRFPAHYQKYSISKEGMQHSHTNFKLHTNNEVNSNISSGKRGHWIKTDADYLVLEL